MEGNDFVKLKELFSAHDMTVGAPWKRIMEFTVPMLIGNLALQKFTPGFEGQPIAHTEWLWNLLGMVLVGWGSVLLGGCPLRQLILAGEGNTDSAVTVTGFIVGAAISHNFGLASSGNGIGTGPVAAAVAAGFVVLAVISVTNMQKLEG